MIAGIGWQSGAAIIEAGRMSVSCWQSIDAPRREASDLFAAVEIPTVRRADAPATCLQSDRAPAWHDPFASGG